MILLNNYIILAISLVAFIIFVQILKIRSESKRRLGFKERKELEGIKDENSKKEIKTKEIVSNTRADSSHNIMPASDNSEQKISLNNNILLENIAQIVETKLEELGGKTELLNKEGKGIIEERTNKNGKKYYFNTETKKFAKKADFIKGQKENHRADVSGKNTFSINSVEKDNQNNEIANIIASGEENENGKESVPSFLKEDRELDVSGTQANSTNSVKIENKNYESGLLLLKKKQFNQAIDYFSKVIELNPADGALYYYRGLAKNNLNLLNDAIEDYTKAMLQQLNKADVFYKRGECKYNLGDKSGALKDFTRYISIDKHNSEAYYYKGLLEYETENYSAVIEDLNRAIELNPNHESAYFRRGMAKEKTGDKNGCFNDLKIAIDKGSLEAYHYLKKFRN